MILKEQVVSGVKWSGVSMGVTATLQFVTLAVLARFLSPSDFGLMGMIMVVIGLAQVFTDMGVSNAIIHRQDVTKHQLSSLYWLNIFAGVVVFSAILFCVPLVVRFYKEPRLYNLLYLAAMIFLITPFGQQSQILLQKELAFDKLARINIGASAINSTIAVVLACTGFGVYSLIWGHLAGASANVLLLLNTGWKNWRPEFHFSRADLKGYLSFGIYQMGEKAVNYLNTNLDYLLIGSMLGAKPLGYYTLAYNLIIRPSAIINPIITRVAFPVFSKIQNETERLQRGYLKVLQLLSMVNFPIMAGLAVVAPTAIPVIFGKQWIPSIVLIQILTIVGLLRSVANPVGSLILAKGRADLGLKWNLAITATQIPALFFGAKLGDTLGVAIAFAIVMVVYSIFNYLILIRSLVGPCLRDYVQSMWPSFWMSLMMGAVVFAVGLAFENASRMVILIIQIMCGATVFLTLMFHNQRILLIELKGIILKKKLVVTEK